MKFLYSVFAIIIVSSLTFFDYYFPEKEVYDITGSEVKRFDEDGPISKNNPESSATYDVYYIFAEKDKVTRVFRNEDNIWYLKWVSADLQAKATSAQKSNDKVVITSYGWRFNYLQWYPNAVNIEILAEGEDKTVNTARWTNFTWLFILSAFYIALFYLMFKIAKLVKYGFQSKPAVIQSTQSMFNKFTGFFNRKP